jgi:hypothetical protein
MEQGSVNIAKLPSVLRQILKVIPRPTNQPGRLSASVDVRAREMREAAN